MKMTTKRGRMLAASLSGCIGLLVFCVGPAAAFPDSKKAAGWTNIPAPLVDRISDHPVRPVVHGGAPHPPKKAVTDETSGICPQPRHTPQAPVEYDTMTNPLEPTARNLTAGEALFKIDAKPTACKVCHGLGGDGLGIIFERLQPKPRNFTCYYTMEDISDGQMYWIIKNGSPGTAMPAFGSLSDKEIWQLILYLRQFGKKQ